MPYYKMTHIRQKTISVFLVLLITVITASTLNAEEKSDFSGKWVLVKFEKIEKGRRTEVSVSRETIVIENNSFMLNQESGPDPGVYKIDNNWHKKGGKNTRAYWSSDGSKLFRLIRKKQKGVNQQVLEMRVLKEGGALMEIDRKMSTVPGFFTSITGLGMPHEEYEKREILLFMKK